MMKRFILPILVFVLALTNSGIVTATETAYDEGFWNSNDILFYDPRVGPCESNEGASIQGGDNIAKIWSWLIAKGMSEIGAAGIMGNMQVESGFNPFRLQVTGETFNTLVDDAGYNRAFGLVQWDGSRRVEVLEYLAKQDAEYKQYVSARYGAGADAYKEAPPNINDAFITHELDFMYKEATPGGGRPTTWRNLLAAKTPEAAADVFEEIFEGSVRTGGGPHSDAAGEIFAKYQGTAAAMTDDPKCSGDTAGGSLTEGGLTEQQARKFMMNYGANIKGDSARHTGANWDNCNGGGSNCVTFSQFFINKFTSEGPRSSMGNGEDVVSNLRADGVPTGNKPRLFAVFSWRGGTYGHTGVVLGIQGNNIVVGHASCGHSGIGKGDGTYEGGGSGFVRVGKVNDPYVWLGQVPTEFAYPRGISTQKIQGYINGVI